MIGAFDQDQLIGAAWSRLFPLNDPGYGTVNETIPELTLVVDHSYQQRGIGANLLKQLLIELKQAGYQQLSLSVTKENHARQLYEKHGFMVIETNTNKDDIIMLKTL